MSFITSLLGTGVQMFGQYEQGKSQQLAYNVQADQIEMQGKEKIEAIEGSETEKAGEQRAAYARAGVMNSGSALDVELETATNYEYDKLTAKYNMESAASAARYKGRMAMLGAIGNMGNSLTNFGTQALTKGMLSGDKPGGKIPTNSDNNYNTLMDIPEH